MCVAIASYLCSKLFANMCSTPVVTAVETIVDPVWSKEIKLPQEQSVSYSFRFMLCIL